MTNTPPNNIDTIVEQVDKTTRFNKDIIAHLVTVALEYCPEELLTPDSSPDNINDKTASFIIRAIEAYEYRVNVQEAYLRMLKLVARNKEIAPTIYARTLTRVVPILVRDFDYPLDEVALAADITREEVFELCKQ